MGGSCLSRLVLVFCACCWKYAATRRALRQPSSAWTGVGFLVPGLGSRIVRFSVARNWTAKLRLSVYGSGLIDLDVGCRWSHAQTTRQLFVDDTMSPASPNLGTMLPRLIGFKYMRSCRMRIINRRHPKKLLRPSIS